MAINNRAEYKSYLKRKLFDNEGTLDEDALAEILTDLEWRLSSCEATCNRVEPE